jgi:PST family polysaccharide transporter
MSEADARKVRFGSAVRWATAMSWGQDGLSAVTTFVLALILGPEDFGVVVVALTFVGLIELFVSQGFVGAIVQRRDLEEVDLDSIFWITVALGLALTLGGVAASGLVANFYAIPRLAPLVQALSLCVLIRGLTVVQEAKLTRDMDFKSLALRTNLSVIAGAIVGVALAAGGAGAWALVGQSLARGVSGLVVLWRAARWTPRPRIDGRRTGEMVVFSIKCFPATLFDFLGSQAEPLLIGKFFGETAVGVYRLAMRLLDLVVTVVTRALWYVAFPYFSEAKGDVTKLRARVTDCLRYSSLCSLPVLVVLGLESPSFVHVLGPKWAQATDVVQILCVYGALRSLTLFVGPLLFASGRPQVFSAIMGVQVALLCAGIGAAGVFLSSSDLQAQVSGIAWARVAVYVAVFLPVAIWVMVRTAGVSFSALGAAILPGVAVAASAGVVQMALGPLTQWAGTPPVAGFAIRMAAVGVATALTILAVDGGVRTAAGRVFRPKMPVPAGHGESGAGER